MKTFFNLMNIILLISLVNGHGYLADPLNRGKNNGHQHSDRTYSTGI